MKFLILTSSYYFIKIYFLILNCKAILLSKIRNCNTQIEEKGI